jgi:orotate phosphoribosyltransferase
MWLKTKGIRPLPISWWETVRFRTGKNAAGGEGENWRSRKANTEQGHHGPKRVSIQICPGHGPHFRKAGIVIPSSLHFHYPMTSDEALKLFRKTGALLGGHFILRSGMHSRQYFQCALALQQMPVVEQFGRALAEKVRNLEPATVISPALGGLVIGQEVARQLGLRFIFVEKEENKLALRRGFHIKPGERMLVVEDVITQGGRVRETMEIVRQHQGHVIGVAMLVDRSNGAIDLGVPQFSLISLTVETFPPDQLPEDLKQLPPVKPGSK